MELESTTGTQIPRLGTDCPVGKTEDIKLFPQWFDTAETYGEAVSVGRLAWIEKPGDDERWELAEMQVSNKKWG